MGQRRPAAERHDRDRLESGGGREIEPPQEPARRAQLKEERHPVDRRLELTQELSQLVRVGKGVLGEVLELEIHERRDDHGERERRREELDVPRSPDDLPPRDGCGGVYEARTVLAMAVDLWLEVEAEEADEPEWEFEGEGAEQLQNEPKPLSTLAMRGWVRNGIPVGVGLHALKRGKSRLARRESQTSRASTQKWGRRSIA